MIHRQLVLGGKKRHLWVFHSILMLDFSTRHIVIYWIVITSPPLQVPVGYFTATRTGQFM